MLPVPCARGVALADAASEAASDENPQRRNTTTGQWSPPMTRPSPSWLSVPCPTCGVEPGCDCQQSDERGLVLRLRAPHAARKRAAKEKAPR